VYRSPREPLAHALGERDARVFGARACSVSLLVVVDVALDGARALDG
jgi:hypothetical protein